MSIDNASAGLFHFASGVNVYALSVDVPILVKKEKNRNDARIDIPWLVRTEGIGPVGWNEAVIKLINGLP